MPDRRRSDRRYRVQLTTRGASLLTAGLATAAGAVLLGEADLLAIGVALVLLVGCCVLLLLIRRPRSVVSHDVRPSEARPGEPVAVVAHTQLTSAAPIGELVCRLRTTEALVPSRDLVVDPAAIRRGIALPFQTASRHRGRHVIGPLIMQTRDPFGMATATIADSATDVVLGLPAAHPVDLSWLPERGTGVGAYVGSDLGQSTDLDVSLREHRPADGLRRVHWPTSARLGRLMTRIDEPTADRDCLIVLDDRAVANHGATFEASIVIAASLAEALAGIGYRVWLWHATGPASAPRGGWSVPAIMRHLALAEPTDESELALDPWSVQRDIGGGPLFLITTPYADLPVAILDRVAAASSTAHVLLTTSTSTSTKVGRTGLGARWSASQHPVGGALAESLRSIVPVTGAPA